jgi:hypothetical protein
VRGSLEPRTLIQRNNAAFGGVKAAIRDTDGTMQPQIITDDEEGDFDTRDESVDPQAPIYLTDVRTVLCKGVIYYFALSGNLYLTRFQINRARTHELPGDMPPPAKALIADFQESWGASTETCFHRVRESLLEVLVQVMERIFGRYRPLKQALRRVYIPDLHTKSDPSDTVPVCSTSLIPTPRSVRTSLRRSSKWRPPR